MTSFTAPQCGHGARASVPPQELQNFESAGLRCSQYGHGVNDMSFPLNCYPRFTYQAVRPAAFYSGGRAVDNARRVDERHAPPRGGGKFRHATRRCFSLHP